MPIYLNKHLFSCVSFAIIKENNFKTNLLLWRKSSLKVRLKRLSYKKSIFEWRAFLKSMLKWNRKIYMVKFKSSRPGCSLKKVYLKVLQNSLENTCARVSFLIKLQVHACIFMKKETLAQVFSFEFCKILKNTFSCRTPPVVASVSLIMELCLYYSSMV